MATFSLANQILAGGPMDPRPIEANFTDTATFINDNALTLDGSKALTGALTLFGPGTADGHAVNKAQMDVADDAIVATATANATIASDATTAAIATAASDATTKADAAAELGTANAKTYTDGVKIETQFVQDILGSVLTTTSTAQTFLTTGNIVNAKSGYYIVSVCIDVNIKTVGGYGLMDAFVGELFVDGDPHPSQMVLDYQPNGNIGARQTLSKVWIIANPADTASFQVKVRQVGGTLGSYECDGANHSFIQVLFVG